MVQLIGFCLLWNRVYTDSHGLLHRLIIAFEMIDARYIFVKLLCWCERDVSGEPNTYILWALLHGPRATAEEDTRVHVKL